MRRMLAVLLALIFVCGCGRSLAAPYPTATPEPVTTPTLDPNAIAYDKEHPEVLYPDQLYAWSAILIEASSGDVIFEKDADVFRFPASTTKIMTALVALNSLTDEELDQKVTCSEYAVSLTQNEENVTTLHLQAGEEIILRELLTATLIYSANDGANVIAEAVGGTISHFVDMMNETAQFLGCYNTHFANPNGLHDNDHYTTAYDLAIIARAAMQNDTFRDMVRQQSCKISATNRHRERTVNTTNQLFNPGTAERPNRYYYPDIIGIKTGFTSLAQYCFVGAAARDGVELISVIMYAGDNSRWADTIKLLNYGFAQYISVSPVDLYNTNPIILQTSGYSLKDTGLGVLSLSCVPADAVAARARIIATKDDVEYMKTNYRSMALIDYVRDFTAPIRAGDVIGTLTWPLDSGETVTFNLVADRTIATRDNLPKTIEEIVAETDADTNPFPPFSVELALEISAILGAVVGLYFLIRWLLFGRGRRRGRGPKVKSRYLR